MCWFKSSLAHHFFLVTIKKRIHSIIFEAETREGKLFDVALVVVILFSVLTAILESLYSDSGLGALFYALEWIFTIIFLAEYALRVYSVEKPLKYVLSFYGIIDLVSCLPTLISIFIPGAQSLIVIRALRLLRIFRIFKLATYFSESMVLYDALMAARVKITVFLFSILIIVTLSGAAMHVVEGPENGFTNIPTSMYWAVVTLTTVGYGDLSPKTDFGRFLASVIMVLGYAIIAVPTGIITSELTKSKYLNISNRACPGCGSQGHGEDATFCRNCGAHLNS